MMRVRSGKLEDAQAVGRLAEEFAAYLRGLGDAGPLEMNAHAFARDGFGASSAFSSLVAEENEIVGYLLYHFGYDADLAARNLHVVDLYVDAKARRRGIGRSLMREAAKRCRDAGGAELIWSVFKPNRVATKFYESLGARYTKHLVYMTLDADNL